MRRHGSDLRLAATDLSNHLACRHLTELDRSTAEGRLSPPGRQDPMLDVLRERGFAHEEAYLEHLRDQGLEVVEIPSSGSDEEAAKRTREAMAAGKPAIAQPVFLDDRWYGRADLLLRVETPSELGAWSYEVVDTKLAMETRGGTVLQICLYSEMLGEIQGRLPDTMHVVRPGAYAEPQSFPTSDYMAYFRLVRSGLERALGEAEGPEAIYPEPVPHCDVCRWWPRCTKRRKDDDHLSLVAGLGRAQQREFEGRGLRTLEKLASATLPFDPRPERGSPEAYERLHHQARVQLASRSVAKPVYERLEPIEPGHGLARLPEPTPADIFLDFEGDPFVEGGGREYLFGWVTVDPDGKPHYERRWAVDPAAERAAFEEFVDLVMMRWAEEPGLHVYHFGHYEPSALKRMMGRYATREEEIDQLLRGERLVDLHGVVRQGLRVGVEHYSLKDLEALHDFERELDLRDASAELRRVERCLELDDAESIPAESRKAVEDYNREDCVSTWSLRGWLEEVREEAIAAGRAVPRPEPGEGEASEEMDERQQRLLALFERLAGDVPIDPAERTPEQQARWLLGHQLEFHRREGKATWWEFFRLRDLAAEDLLDERAGLAGLEYVSTEGGTAKCPIHRYAFPEQDQDIREGKKLHDLEGTEVGDVVAIDSAARLVDVKKRSACREQHPNAVFAHDFVRPKPIPEAIEAVAEWVAQHGIDASGPFRAARDLLLGRPPRLDPAAAGALRHESEDLNAAARRLVLELGEGVLPVQGPPGSGKTYMGARMICELVRAGKKVGVTAGSHKVVRNLLEEVVDAANQEGIPVRCIQKQSDVSETEPEGITETKSNGAVLAALESGEAQVAGGTAWLWAREEYRGSVDVLVVDEAGQMSLANTIAVATAARSLVLLGDPQQLEQPLQGSHPEGTDVSALQHVLGEHETMPDHRGLFLAETWRLHPAICRFTSEIFYEGRLDPRPGRECQQISGPTLYTGAGLWLVPVEHEGNQSSAPEEVAAVAEIVDSLLREGVTWTHPDKGELPLGPSDVLVVAPYNAQVGLLAERLPDLRIGTVDKFQGQEAPVVIYSMTSSSAEDAPRGMEFVYNLHRLNVATSRARCACILVASPRLLEAECRSPHQMRLANALCRYGELGQEWRPGA